jgi:predicted  nucleic acid-binding Zn-ribbon protein
MSEDQITDLKNFITTTVTDAMMSVRNDLKSELNSEIKKVRQDIKGLRTEMRSSFTTIAQSVDRLNDDTSAIQLAIKRIHRASAF